MMQNLGYPLLFFSSFMAATVLPFSSELILSGMLAAGFDPFLTLTVATLGNWTGGLTSYWIGWLGKWSWIEKYLRIPATKIRKLHQKIEGKEGWVALFCWLPFIGDPLAVALGLLKTRFVTTAIWMLTGKAIRYIIWAYLTLQTISFLN